MDSFLQSLDTVIHFLHVFLQDVLNMHKESWISDGIVQILTQRFAKCPTCVYIYPSRFYDVTWGILLLIIIHQFYVTPCLQLRMICGLVWHYTRWFKYRSARHKRAIYSQSRRQLHIGERVNHLAFYDEEQLGYSNFKVISCHFLSELLMLLYDVEQQIKALPT